MVRMLTADLTVPRDPKVKFVGDYITKVELEALIRAIRKAHKKMIFEYRKRHIIEEYKASQEKKGRIQEDATNRKSKTSESRESRHAEPVNAVNRAAAKDISANAGSDNGVKGGQGTGGTEAGGRDGSGEGSSTK